MIDVIDYEYLLNYCLSNWSLTNLTNLMLLDNKKEFFMKEKLIIGISLISLMGFISIGSVYSQEASDKSHEEHHPDSKTMPDKIGDMKMNEKGGMMDKMDMDKMKGMMNECMEMHKDGKMCNHDTTEKCQNEMSKEECQKMMKKVKTKTKAKKK